MKKVVIWMIIIFLITLLGLYALPKIAQDRSLSAGNAVKVILVYNPEYTRSDSSILAAYESVLQEEGVPFESIGVFQLVTLSAGDVAKRAPAMILPDGILQHVPPQFQNWAGEYMSRGGNAAVIFDAGTRNQKGYFLKRAAFADLVHLNYITFSSTGSAAFDHAHIMFSSAKNREFFQVPLGKTSDGLTLSGYHYGALSYAVARNQPYDNLPAKDIYAYGITSRGEKFPAIVLTDSAAGKALYVNLPLGYLKSDSDDLPLRAMLRTFLFDVVGVPHIMNVEAGRGGIVIDWHIDSSVEYKNLPQMVQSGMLRKDLPASFDISAGDFRDKPGDGLGFDACGKGKSLAEELKEYGQIGSHGGWGHNWFAKDVENGTFKDKEIREYILKNNECLETITGSKIIEYAAPVGVHPQPSMTKVIESLGMIAYYYTGDTGSGPNRTFYDGKMVSDKVVAFPVMPLGRDASLYEMAEDEKKSAAAVKGWLLDILSYSARNRTVRLFYSHPYNISYYPEAVKAFIARAAQMQKEGLITARPMGYFARFFLRAIRTTYAFKDEPEGLRVSLENPEGLSGITAALPKAHYLRPQNGDFSITEDGKYYYVTITGNETKKDFMCARS
ncbi:MAG TPA: hypothetical protein VK448_01545 [Dissulfurispiraceae bacterium]|nr:hypothetical protein [Dissulfurispiraceae bacterium]